MLLKITEKCSAGCIHCLSDCKPDGAHMSMDTLKNVMDFIINNDLCRSIGVTGGEPTEHPEFIHVINYIIDRCKETGNIHAITITTNGFWVIDHQEEAIEIVNKSTENVVVTWQVSTDSRYYTKKLDTTKRIFREKGFFLCTDCVLKLDMMGRAKENNLDDGTHKKCSSCYNLRAVARQMYERGTRSLGDIIQSLELIGRFCTPAIRIDGGISFGESDLCPKSSSIYKSHDEVLQDLLECSCKMCGQNDHLSLMYKILINN